VNDVESGGGAEIGSTVDVDLHRVHTWVRERERPTGAPAHRQREGEIDSLTGAQLGSDAGERAGGVELQGPRAQGGAQLGRGTHGRRALQPKVQLMDVTVTGIA